MKTTGSAEQNDPKAEKARPVPSAQQRPASQAFLTADARSIALRAKGICLTGESEIEYVRSGRRVCFTPCFDVRDETESHSDEMHLYSAKGTQGGLSVLRETRWHKQRPLTVEMRLTVENKTGSDILLKTMTPLRVTNAAAIFAGTDSRDWLVLRQGRMKNDLPAVCRLGDTGPAFQDALSSLRESGGAAQADENAYRILSDQMTVLRGGNASLLMGFMTAWNCLYETLLTLDEQHRCAALRCSCVYDSVLPDGHEAPGEWLRLDLSYDSASAIWRYASDKAVLCGARKSTAPAVFCTWYYYGLTVTQDDMLRELDALARRKIPFDVFQLDEGWERVAGDWRLNGKFSMTLPEIAGTIRTKGFIPGIWTAPFIVHETAPAAALHDDWLLRSEDGSYCLFPMNGTVYRILDITRPEVLAWIEKMYRELRACGFLYHKLDFTRAPVAAPGAVRFDSCRPWARAYRDAISAVRRGIGEDAYLLICGGLYDPVIGLADGQRTGSDVLSMWYNPSGRGGQAVPFTMKQNILRIFMNAWWNNDPDALMVRRRTMPERGLNLTYGLLNDDEALTFTLNQYLSGGLVCSTEPMCDIEDDRLSLLRHILPIVPVRSEARDLFSGGRYPAVIDVTVRKGTWHTVALINWSDAPVTPDVRLDSNLVKGLVPEKEYRVCEFFSGLVTENLRTGSALRLPRIAPHGCLLVKIEPMDESRPALVGSTAHFSFGGEVKRLEIAEDTLFFETDCPFETPVTYRIALPHGTHCAHLPAFCAWFAGRLTICLPGRGHYRIAVPLRGEERMPPL